MFVSHKYKSNLKILTPIILWIAFLISVYMPFLAYRGNSEYFSESLLVLLAPIAIVVLPFFLCVLLILAFSPKKITFYLTAILTVGSVLMWLQGDLFSISYGKLDGVGLTFHPYMLRGIIELLVIVICLLIAIIFRNKINQYGPTLIVLIFIAQLGIIGFSLLTEKKQNIKKEQSINKDNNDELFAFSSDDNVVVIVLDAFGSEYFQKILQQDEHVSRELQGFISYTDAISQYPQTRYSLVSFLTGSMIPEDVNYSEYLSGTVAEEGLPKHYENQDYLVSVVSTAYIWFSEFYKERFLFRVPDLNKPVAKASDGMKLLDYGLFRISPHIFKHHIYNNGFWFFSDYLSGYTQKPDIYPTRAAEMLDYYTDKLHVAGEKPRFKFLHFVLPHPKFVYNKECEFKSNIKYSSDAMLQQSKCAIKKLLALFKVMKNKGIYDSSLIVVMSDHGAKMYKSDEERAMPSEFELKSSGVLLMIKNKHAKEEFIQDATPVSLLGVSQYLTYLSTGAEKRLKQENERLFYSYRSNVGFTKSDIPAGIMYAVKPQYSKNESWQVEKIVTAECHLVEPIGILSLQKNHSKSICFKHGFRDYSEKVGGLEMVGSEGVIVWETSAISSANDFYELKINVANANALNISLQINKNSVPLKQIEKKQKDNTYIVLVNGSYFKNKSKFELFLNSQYEHKDKVLTHSQTKEHKPILQSIKISAPN